MVGIVLTAEQVKAAPPSVRQWLEQQLAADLAPVQLALPGLPSAAADIGLGRIDACSLPEIMQIFEQIRHDGLACRVFLEFGREPSARLHPSPLYALDLGEIAGATGISSGKQLGACLNLINSAFQMLRADPAATLFAIDAGGRCYLQETTHRALHLLRRDLLAPPPAPQRRAAADFALSCEPPYRCVAGSGTDSPETVLLT